MGRFSPQVPRSSPRRGRGWTQPPPSRAESALGLSSGAGNEPSTAGHKLNPQSTQRVSTLTAGWMLPNEEFPALAHPNPTVIPSPWVEGQPPWLGRSAVARQEWALLGPKAARPGPECSPTGQGQGGAAFPQLLTLSVVGVSPARSSAVVGPAGAAPGRSPRTEP